MPKPLLKRSKRLVEWNEIGGTSKCGRFFIDFIPGLGFTVYHEVEAKAWAMLEPGVHHKTKAGAMESVESYCCKYPPKQRKL